MPIITNWGELSNDLEAGLKSILNELIDDSITELDGPIRIISSRLAIAARRRRGDLVEECKDQLLLIVVEKEMKLRGVSFDVLGNLLSMGMNALVNGAIAGLGAIKTA